MKKIAGWSALLLLAIVLSACAGTQPTTDRGVFDIEKNITEMDMSKG